MNPYEKIRAMARKIVNPDFDQALHDDVFQSGCEAYLEYSTPEFFPTESIKYYMLNEVAFWRYHSSHQGKKTAKREHASIDENEFLAPSVSCEAKIEAADAIKCLVDKCSRSVHQKERLRTLYQVAEHGAPMGKSYDPVAPDGVKMSTYWSACRSLRRFAAETLQWSGANG